MSSKNVILVVAMTLVVTPAGEACRERVAETELRIGELGGGAKAVPGDVKIRIELINHAATKVLVNGRGLVASQHDPDTVRDLWLTVVDAWAGERLDFDCRLRAGPAEASDFRVVDPGGTLAFVRDLGCFNMAAGGKYRVVAHLDVPTRSSVLQEGLRGPKVPLVSNQITVLMGTR